MNIIFIHGVNQQVTGYSRGFYNLILKEEIYDKKSALLEGAIHHGRGDQGDGLRITIHRLRSTDYADYADWKKMNDERTYWIHRLRGLPQIDKKIKD